MLRDYRLYFTDGKGHFLSVVELACSDDAEAIAVAASRPDGQGMELWERARRVKSWKVGRER